MWRSQQKHSSARSTRARGLHHTKLAELMSTATRTCCRVVVFSRPYWMWASTSQAATPRACPTRAAAQQLTGSASAAAARLA